MLTIADFAGHFVGLAEGIDRHRFTVQTMGKTCGDVIGRIVCALLLVQGQDPTADLGIYQRAIRGDAHHQLGPHRLCRTEISRQHVELGTPEDYCPGFQCYGLQYLAFSLIRHRTDYDIGAWDRCTTPQHVLEYRTASEILNDFTRKPAGSDTGLDNDGSCHVKLSCKSGLTYSLDHKLCSANRPLDCVNHVLDVLVGQSRVYRYR